MEEQYNNCKCFAKIVFLLSMSWNNGNSWRLHQFSKGISILNSSIILFYLCKFYFLYCTGENFWFSRDIETLDIFWLPNNVATIAQTFHQNRWIPSIVGGDFIRKVPVVWNTWSRCFLQTATFETTNFTRMFNAQGMCPIRQHCHTIRIQDPRGRPNNRIILNKLLIFINFFFISISSIWMFAIHQFPIAIFSASI